MVSQEFDSAARAHPVLLRVYQNLLDSVAEEMGTALERTGFSPNIKERRDYSCALFDANGEMLAHAAHIPVHLGSTPLAVRAALDAHSFAPGDAILLNDPYRGGTHLPDLTLVSAVFTPGLATPVFYVANRAHHADIGGAVRGSMAIATEIYGEGLRIPPVLVRCGGIPVADIEALLFANMRQPDERRGDLAAQLAALNVGEKRLLELLATCDRAELLSYCGHLQAAAERHVRALLAELPDGEYHAVDFLESDGVDPGPIELRVCIHVVADSCTVDFTGSAAQRRGNINATPAIAMSAVFYVLRALAGSEIPANSGCLKPVRLVIPEGSILNPLPPAAVAGGNVETSQRLVDLLFAALEPALPDRVAAQSQGTMNNITLGAAQSPHGAYSYYETLGGGAGGSPAGPGASGIHTHMTNTRNTPIEMLERALPIRVTAYSLRRASGGAGLHRGGDGLIREYELLAPAEASILSECRTRAPRGIAGGEAGQVGKNILIRDGAQRELPAKWQGELVTGDRLRIETPGGAGWGRCIQN
ncbi:MAG: hydantoinase B/oxoprolinase family protein [Planctomycetota bacterium]